MFAECDIDKNVPQKRNDVVDEGLCYYSYL